MFKQISILLLLTSCAQLKEFSNLPSKLKSNFALDKIERDASHFNVKWAKNLDPEYNSGNLPISTASPLIHEDLLFQGDLSGHMGAYDLETGTVVWRHKEDQPINSKPTFFQEHVLYATMSGRLYSRHYLTGKLNYAIDLKEAIESAVVVSQGRMYAHLRNHKLIAMDAATGKIFWSYRRSVPYTTTLQRVSRVLPYKNRLIVGFADGNLVCLNKDEGVVVWEQKISEGVKFVDVDTDPVYFNGFIVASAAQGKMRFVDPESGLIVKAVDLTAAHAPVKYNNELVVGTVFGEVARVDQNGKVIIKRKISNTGIGSVVPWKNGYAVSSMSGQIMQLDATTLKVLQTFELGSEQSSVFGFLQYNRDYLAVYSSRNRLYVFK